MSDGFDDLDDELLALGSGDDASDGHHSDDESKAATSAKQTSGAAASGDESEGAISDSTIGSRQSRKGKPTTVVTSPSPPRRTVDGDDDDDDGVAGGKKGMVGRKRPSPGDDESSPPKKRAKGPVGGKKGKKRRGSDDDDDDDRDEGSLSDTPSSVIVSEPISSDDDEMADSPADLYPYDGIYKSAAEKAEVDKYNQLQREQFIADRKEEVDRYRENEQMANRARLQKLVTAKKKKKRSADDDDYDDSLHASTAARRSTRGDSSAKKTADSKKNASLSALKQKRHELDARKAGGGNADRSKKKRQESVSEGEDEGSVDEHEQEAEFAASQEKQSVHTRKGSEEATFEDIKLLMVTRNTIAKYWTYPGFEAATTGCFVRVSIGNHPDTGKLIYRLCQIKSWQDSKSIYEVSSGDRTIKYRRNAVIATGAAEKPTRVDVISDSPPTEDEWRWYLGAMEVAKLKRPDVAFVERKRKETKNVTTHQLTSEDFDAMRRMRTSYYPDDPVLPNLDLPSLKKRRQQLVDEGDESEILRIDRELEWRAPPRALTAALNRPTQLDILGQINKRNREINRQDIRKAQLEEKKRNEIAARMAAENGDSSFMDPFARVKTHAKIYHNEKPKEKDTDMDDLFEDDGDKEKEKEKNGGVAGLGKTDNKVPQVQVPQHKGIDAAIASMDLQFDIDFTDI